MESARVCVIDSSPSIRETITIVLGGEHRVTCLSGAEYLRDPASHEADLFIVADDELPKESLRLLPRGRPVLWLQSGLTTRAVDPGRGVSLPRSFGPEDLRRTVRALLNDPVAARPSFEISAGLDYPILPLDVARLARRAVATGLPVLICGAPGTGKARLARAIHAANPFGRFVHLADATFSRTALEQAGSIGSGNLTLLVHDVSLVSAEAQQLLSELLDCGGVTSSAGWHGVRLICGTSQSLSDLARAPSFDRDVFYRLSVLPLTLPLLRDRVADIPALATHIAAEIARALETAPVTFTPRALERLTNYLWFGNLAELETVLTRTVALAPDTTIDADDLLFGYGRITPRQADARAATGLQSSPQATLGGNTSVDLIINELAHEFKNPMVTIKTIAQHMERLLGDDEGRQDVARLTGEAVDRMDRVLENLLQFTRFRRPARDDVPLASLLAPCLSNLAPTLSEHRVTLDYRPPNSHAAFVDAAQIEYALDNLLHVIARDLQEGQTLSIHPSGSTSALAFEYPSTGHSFAGTLSHLLDDTRQDGDAVPLGLVLAKTLIERNGGHIETRTSAAAVSVTVWLPSREEMARGNGKTTNPSS